MNRRIGALGAIAVLVVLALGISNASAASLSVIAGKLGTFAANHPCPGTATATVATGSGTTYSAVSVTVPVGCTNRRLDVTLLNGSTVLRSGNANVAGSGATTVTFTGTYTASSSLTVLAVVDGWNLPTGWTYLPPATGVIVAGNRDTELTVGDWFTSGTLTCAPVTAFVTTGNKTWRINVNTASAPFDGAAPVFTGQDAYKVTTIGAPALGGLQLVGGIHPYEKLQQNQDVPLVFNICG